MEQPLQIPKHRSFRSFRICIYQTGTKEWDKGFGGHLSTAVIKQDGWENNSDIVRIISHSVVKTALNGIREAWLQSWLWDEERGNGGNHPNADSWHMAYLFYSTALLHHSLVQKCNQPSFRSKATETLQVNPSLALRHGQRMRVGFRAKPEGFWMTSLPILPAHILMSYAGDSAIPPAWTGTFIRRI